ncbi:nuclear transport factor 2 family protein [Mucilaginibacter sp. BT774]|uniref:YybH family protein n=1 Tax=Mucilaginibacter sp. BT774 TaxID=3062276 RepID=UPI0026751F88|nr:nuclear transport factor 2 family protein [Mucilaginibacter sp. BT774]MDO3627749.1 nuclear transport factor 2 family protein [Mucilaginibacter sp. BT774]
MKRNNIQSAIFLFAMFCLFNNCDAQQHPTENPNLEEAKKAIAKSNSIYFQAFAKGDSSIFIDRYAKDCWIMPPNAPALCGADAPLEFFRIAYHKFGLRNGRFITTDVFGDGREFVTEVGFWQSFDVDNKMFDNGKFLVLWKKTPNGWKMFRDSFSSDHDK